MSDENPFEGVEKTKIKREKEKKKKPGRPSKKSKSARSSKKFNEKYEKSLLAQMINAPFDFLESGEVPELSGKVGVTLGGAIAYDLEYYGVEATTDHPALVTLLGLVDAAFKVYTAHKKRQGQPEQKSEPAYAHSKSDII